MKASIHSKKFNKVLNQFNMIDENNRNLETVLSLMVGGHWKAAVHSTLDNNPSRQQKLADFSREPEILHVQRLHRLYGGLGYFALWFLNRESPVGSKYLEKAKYRLSEVKSLIEFGHIGDVFLLPLIQIHFNEGRADDILPLLEMYASLQPYNPNTDRFLAEWYLHAATGRTALPRKPKKFRKAIKKSLILDGFLTQALEIVFKLLDHPSWCGFDQPWRLLQTCVRKLGSSSNFVSKMWTPRAKTWKRYIFRHPALSPEGVSAKSLLKSVPQLKGVSDSTGALVFKYLRICVNTILLVPPKMEILGGISSFQVDFGKTFAYFQQARSKLAEEEEEEEAKLKKKVLPTPITQELEGMCVCLNRKVYFPQKCITAYKRLLATISAKAGSTNPEELPEFNEFQELHCQLKAAQQEALEELQSCLPCGHLVLPIELEESFIQFIHQEQLSRVPDGVYKLVNSSKFGVERASTAKLAHLMSFGEDCSLDIFSLNQKTLCGSMSADSVAKRKAIEPNCLGIAPDANVIVDADVLVRVLTYLNSNSRCFFPVNVVSSPLDHNKRVVLLHKPFLAEPLRDNRLRAQEYYTELCKQAFVNSSSSTKTLNESPGGNASNSDDEMEGALTIDPAVTLSVGECSPNPRPSLKDLRTVLERCHVVENAQEHGDMEILQEPASPEIPTSPICSPPLHSCSSPTPLATTQVIPEDNRRWNLFKLGQLNILVSSCGVQLTSQSCAFTTDCLFWPKCSDLWSDVSKSDPKIVHLEVRPEYLQPWGCEELTEDEIFSSFLGAQLSSPQSPTILRLRVEASTGRVILAEVQTLDQLLQSSPNLRFETHLAALVNMLSPLTRLEIGQYLLSSQMVRNKVRHQLYELFTGEIKANTSTASIVKLNLCATEAFHNAGLAFTSTSNPTSDRGATWRWVKRHRLDLSIPSGVDGDNLLIPAIDTGYSDTTQSPPSQTTIKKSSRKRPPSPLSSDKPSKAKRGVVEDNVYQSNITDFYLSHYPEDLKRLIEMSRRLEESVNMSKQHFESFGRKSGVKMHLHTLREVAKPGNVGIKFSAYNIEATLNFDVHLYYVVAGGDDLYDKLHVSRSATTKELKAAYRREATIWHPDKNPSEGAEQKFIEITKAYEILSDPQKRAKYDAYGVYDLGDKSSFDEGASPVNPDLFANLFGGHFFPFGHVPRDENVEAVTFSIYREKLLAASRSTPLMLLGISHFCFMCRQIQPLWSQIAGRYSHLGVIFGIANIQDDHALREELNVLHSPSIVAVLDGKVSYFMRSEFTEEAIIDYLVQALLSIGPLRSSPLPGLPSTTLGTPLMATVSNEAELKAFHSGVLEDSRPRTLFVKAASRPPLRFCLAAFRAVDFHASGFVNTQNSVTEPMIQRLNLSRSEESIVIFHESLNEAVISHSATHLPRHIIDDVLMKNSRLAVPRILNSARFLDLCPADGHPPSSAFASAAETTKGTAQDGHTGHRHLCLILLLHHHHGKDRAWLDLFRSALVPSIPYALAIPLSLADLLPRDFSPILSPAHIFIDRQAAWIDNITASSTCPRCLGSLANLDGHLLALWRISSRILGFQLLPRNSGLHPAEISSTKGYTERLKKTLSGLVMDMVAVDDFLKSHDVRKVKENVAGWSLAYLPRMEELLVDELAAPLWLRIRLKAWSLCRTVISYFDGMWADPMDFFLTSSFTFILLTIIVVYRVGWDLWSEIAPSSSTHSSTSHSPPPMKDFTSSSVSCKLDSNAEPKNLLLTPSTYDRLVLAAPKGQFTILLCTDASPLGQRLADQFYNICRTCGSSTGVRLVPACLFLDRYSNWLGWALEAATRIPFPMTFNPANCRGTVLAVNGYRRYFHMYHPLLPGAKSRSYSQDSEYEMEDEDDGYEVRRRHVTPSSSKELRRVANFSRLLGLNRSSDEESNYESEDEDIATPTTPLLEHEVLAGLPTWFDRLFEGSLRRHHVPEWPRHLTLSL
ncbi:hypothetical protein TcWFU_003321 [Taenia crassiceps]|uniref:J domain-containing protein n=1 Tax=Taenia crassiceps TaxID=6207 RepID=A0ABR4Q6Y7_9CEST